MGDWDETSETGNVPVQEKRAISDSMVSQGAKIMPTKAEKINPVPDEDRLKFSDEKIKNWLFDDIEKSSSNVCCALYGHDGTAKSGIAMDCRTAKEKEEGMRVVIFDLDGGCAPLKVIYHDNDKNIIIKNPLVRDEYKKVDYEATFAKLKAALDYIERNLTKMNIKAIVFDGLDKFLKICEYSMRETVNKTVVDGVDFRYWKIRSQKYHDVIEQIKLMDVDRYFITHLKKSYEEGDDNYYPDWEKKTPDMMFQKVRCYRETKTIDGEKIVYLKAEIEKCKTNLALEGDIYTIAEIKKGIDGKTTATWYGMYFNKDNTISQSQRDN